MIAEQLQPEHGTLMVDEDGPMFVPREGLGIYGIRITWDDVERALELQARRKEIRHEG